MTLKEKKKKLQSIDERELRENVLVPLLQALGYSGVYTFHGPTEKGKDIIFRETSKIGESIVYAAVVSTANITAKVGDPNSAQRILDQVQMALDEPFEDKFTGRDTEVERCWVITSGRMLPSATASISNSLKKYNLSKVVRFIDVDQLIELIDQSFPGYWTHDEAPYGQRLDRFDVSPDNRFVIHREYSLNSIWLYRNVSNSPRELLRLPTAHPTHNDAVTLWSPDCNFLAYYIHSKRGAWSDVFEVGELDARLLPKPEYKLSCYEKLVNAGVRHRPRFDSETPVRWTSKSRVLLLRKGRIQFLKDPPEWLDYEYEVEFECEDGHLTLTDLREIHLNQFGETV
jgi:hypothetical protein